MSEFRFNKLTNQWILFAPNRAKKPMQIDLKEDLVSNEQCPFDKGKEDLTPNELARIGSKETWRCRVVPNLYNALSIEQEPTSSKEKTFEKKSGFGAHEVIIETPDHDKQMFDFDIHEFYDYFTLIKIRLEDLRKDIRLKYFSVFKNHGIDSGASQAHSHSQLIATPFLPPKVKEELKICKNYKNEHERDFFDDLIYDEKLFKKGILKQNNFFLAYCPYASQYPFEIIIIAKQNVSSIINMKDDMLYALSEISQYVYDRLNKTLGNISFNMVLKNGDIQNPDNPNRFHIRIMPRLYKTAGFELDSDIFINTFMPEDAARILKEQL